MLITDDIVGEKYEELIRYAFNHSDAMMVVWVENPIPDKIETVAERYHRTRESLPFFQVTPEVIKSWEEQERIDKESSYLLQRVRKPFLDLLNPFLIKVRHNSEWPSTKVISSNCTFTIATYRLCKELYTLLLQPGGYFSWRYPKYPEDLSFFKDNRCWLYASSHEEYLEFLPRSLDEYNFFRSLNISLETPYMQIDDSERYWEEYIL